MSAQPDHKPIPHLVEMFHRWQCKICKNWINYNEADGEWWHARG
ncbi:hypothetical protein J2T10_001947 [Paenarthrobacter nicotinovorans]|uniref:Uncharacterized protein n=1 Tax=Paenarthrobacter nicotinovorans TaxID=29320 RepID=A0ABT9TKX2_PAENI|nr:hypothetical protein [Paenarthrobacter nicotinovorans]